MCANEKRRNYVNVNYTCSRKCKNIDEMNRMKFHVTVLQHEHKMTKKKKFKVHQSLVVQRLKSYATGSLSVLTVQLVQCNSQWYCFTYPVTHSSIVNLIW